MRHLLLIDPLEKLNLKKDSSLMLALALERRGVECFVFFENDFFIKNTGRHKLRAYSFKGSSKEDGIYLEHFATTSQVLIELNQEDTIHMRLDPPFDSRYLRILWMLDHLSAQGIKVVNHPRGIMNFNEKLYAYRSPGATASFIGTSLEEASEFVDLLPRPLDAIILKPMDLYSGLGVEKLPLNQWKKRFENKVLELKGPVIVQPFMTEVKEGELRSIYFKQKEIGTILKKPKEGEFLSNIAQGATFMPAKLSETARKRADGIARELQLFQVDWIAFDILGDSISEVNITCPGLLVEVSFAHQKNLADVLAEAMLQKD